MQLKSILISLIGLQLAILGSLYSFPLWLPDVKDILHTSQQQLNIIGGLIYIGSFVGMVAAPVLMGFGLKITLGAVGILDSSGYACIFLITQFAATNDWVYAMMIAALVVGIATGIFYSLVMGVTLSIFGAEASPRLNAFCNAFYGLGAIIPSIIYYAEWCHIQTLLLVLFISHVLLAFTLLRMPNIITVLQSEQPAETPQGLSESQPILQKQDDMTSKQAFYALIRGPESWLVILIACLMVPVGTTFSTNLPSIVESIDGNEDRIGEISLIFNLVQTAGRFSVAILSIIWKTRDPTLPLTFLTGAGFGAICLAAHFAIAKSNLIAFVVIFSVFYGWMWCVNGMIYSYVSIPVQKYFSLIMATVNPATGVQPSAFPPRC